MKKNPWGYLATIAVSLALLYFLFRDHIPFGKSNTEFAVSSGTVITRIDLISGRNKVILRQKGDTWTVNNDSEARKSAVFFILKALKELKIKSPVTAGVFRSEVIDRKTEPVRVVAYHNRRPVKSFYVYRTSSNLYGNIMKVKSGSKPYIVYIPGYEDNIGSFFIAQEDFWVPFTAFKILPSEIESIELQNIKEPGESFRLIRGGNRFMIEGIESDSAKVMRYVSYFTSVSFESWADPVGDGQKKVEDTEPLYRIKVKQKVSGEEVLTVWERRSQSDSLKTDTDRVWAEKNNGKGLFVMRYFDLDPLIKKRSYFER